MKILYCHNYYQQRGGEDISFESEVALLRQHGHDVVVYTRDNRSISRMPAWQLGATMFWSLKTYRDIQTLIAHERPDVMHCNNTFPLISPSVFSAARRLRLPIVQSLRNFRYLCANAVLLRQGAICENCAVKRTPWDAIRYKCYRGSRIASGMVAAMQVWDKLTSDHASTVDLFVTPSQFAKQKFVEYGLSPDQIRVKPNFVMTESGYSSEPRTHALYVGRLAPEKGVRLLLQAWKRQARLLPLRIIGDGPDRDRVRRASQAEPQIEWLGHIEHREVLKQIRRAAFLIVPSLWYETFGRAIIEAFAMGVAVIAARLGAMQELIDHKQTGLVFRPGDANDLSEQIRTLEEHPSEWERMGRNALREFLNRFTPEQNYIQLLAIYEEAIQLSRQRRGVAL